MAVNKCSRFVDVIIIHIPKLLTGVHFVVEVFQTLVFVPHFKLCLVWNE